MDRADIRSSLCKQCRGALAPALNSILLYWIFHSIRDESFFQSPAVSN
jgi:hypothetical protein